jgi:ATP-dependent Clp protease ATP-binding subunit ClpC
MYKFTEKAEKVIKLAQEVADEFAHNYIGTEHLLVALIREGNGVASKILAINGIKEQPLLDKIEEVIGHGIVNDARQLGFTPRAKRVLEIAFNEARSAGQDFIGTEHILLAIMRENDSIAVRLLVDLGVDLQKIYNDLGKRIGEGHSKELNTAKKRAKLIKRPFWINLAEI